MEKTNLIDFSEVSDSRLIWLSIYILLEFLVPQKGTLTRSVMKEIAKRAGYDRDQHRMNDVLPERFVNQRG